MNLLTSLRKLCQHIAPRTHSDVEEEFRSTLYAYQEDLIRKASPLKKPNAKRASTSASPSRKTKPTAPPSASVSSTS